MSKYQRFRRRSDRTSLPPYRKTLDHNCRKRSFRCFDLAPDEKESPTVTALRVRIFISLAQPAKVPILLLCWAVRHSGSTRLPEVQAQPIGCCIPMIAMLRQGIAMLPCRVSLIERFIHHEIDGGQTESIHKVLEVLPESKGGRTVLFPLRRSILESTIDEPLDAPDRGHAA